MAASVAKVATPGSLTKDEALSLLHELTSGFGALEFQARLAELIQRYFRAAPGKDRNKLSAERSKLYLEVQGKVLPEYGFSADAKGVFIMWQAMLPYSQDTNWMQAVGLLNAACRQDAKNQLLEPRGLASPPPVARSEECEALEEMGGFREGEPRVSRFPAPPPILDRVFPFSLPGVMISPLVHGEYIVCQYDCFVLVMTLDLEVKWRWKVPCTGVTGVGSKVCAAGPEGLVSCFCVDTGKRLWQRKFCAFADGSAPCCRATPASGGLLLAIGSAEGLPDNGIDGVFALSLADGSEIWRTTLTQLHGTSPVVVADRVVLRDCLGSVSCLHLTTGTLLWCRAGDPSGQPEHFVPQEPTASRALSLVCTCLMGRRPAAWNAPCGGTGAVLALELETGRERWRVDFELEAHVPPVILADRGLVVACLGNRCGPPEGLADRKVVGDSFPGMIVGLSTTDGARIWAWEPPVWASPSCVGVSLGGRNEDAVIPPWTPPVASADGKVLSCFHSGMMYAIDCVTGQEAYSSDLASPPIQRVALGEGVLVTCSFKTRVFRWPQPGPRIAKPLAAPFEETGTDHFFPSKNSRNDHTLTCTSKGPLLLGEPSWAFEAPGGDRRVAIAWYCNPVIDSQRNVYNGTEFGWMWVHRPDGSLRGSIYLGARVTTPIISGKEMFVANAEGYAIKLNLDSLEVMWSKRYACVSSEDTWMPSLSQELVLVGGTLIRPYIPHPTLDPLQKGIPSKHWGENFFVFALERDTGEHRWVFPVPWMVYNLNPTFVWYGEHEIAIIMDNTGGLYFVLCRTGEVVWQRDPQLVRPFHDICGVTMGPNKVIYYGFQDFDFPQDPKGFSIPCMYPQQNGIIEAWDVSSFPPVPKWVVKKPFAGMLQSVVVHVKEEDRYILLVPMGNNGDLPSSTLEDRKTDTFMGIIYGLDSDSGEELWSFSPPPWKTETGSCRASTIYTTYLPASWCSPVVDGRGTLYIYWMGGIMYSIEAATGRVLSSYDLGCCITGSPAVAPGLVVVQAHFRVLVWRDDALEDQWLEEATAAGDPRAKVGRVGCGTSEEARQRGVGWGRGFDLPADGWFMFQKYDTPAEQAAGKPEAAKAEVGKPEAAKPEAEAKPEAAKPEAAKPKAAKSVAEKPKYQEGERRLVVVGGEKSGGISVRMGHSLKSTELIERLATGAVVRELEAKGDRVRYAKVSGAGPEQGWVSRSFKGKDLLRESDS